MNLYDIFHDLEKSRNDENAQHMSRYMRDQFPFLGIKTPKRKEISNPYFKEAKKTKYVNWEFIDYCCEKPYREAQYIAIEYIKMMKDFLLV